ncbi:MAG: VOC family protein [Acidihalobacter sp.]|uniref:VOC family protein n=1 Tax=Acidihalobacter sp. TaxID=1872108 RepID=UPI00307D23C8
MHIEQLDHLVLTVRDIERSIASYVDVLGMRALSFGDNRRALVFGEQKINLHPADAPIAPHAAQPTPGSADLCFITQTPIGEVAEHLATHGVEAEAGPAPRTGARGPIVSVYFRDPDGNLIEVSNYS